MFEIFLNNLRLLFNPIIKFFSYKQKFNDDIENKINEEEIIFINKNSNDITDDNY